MNNLIISAFIFISIPFLLFLLRTPLEATNEVIKVIKVLDGDTILVRINSTKEEKVRLLGVQAPEIFYDPPQDYAYKAKLELEKLILHKEVVLDHKGYNKRDKYKRLLAHVYLKDNNLWVNGYLIEKGLAFTYIMGQKDIPRIKDLKNIEDKAILRENFWINNNYRVISPVETIKYIGNYKVIDSLVYDIYKSKNSLWIYLSEKGSKGFSLRIDNKNHDNILLGLNLKDITQLQGKKIRIRGFIDQYSPKYGPFIEIEHSNMIDILQ